MRTWMIPPEHMCSQHIRGEHFEIHMISGGISTGKTIGLIRTLANQGMVDLINMFDRHEALAKAINQRGGKHKSDLWFEAELIVHSLDLPEGFVDQAESYRELHRRCPACRAQMLSHGIDVSNSNFLDNRPKHLQVAGPNGEFRK